MADEQNTLNEEPQEGVVTQEQEMDVSDLVYEEPEETTPEPEEKEEELPEKYKGKTIAEIARMHEEAQAALSRQGNEVGELRKTFDDYIKQNLENSQQAKPVEEPADFLLEPEKAVQQAIDNHPKLKQAEQVIASVAQQQNIERIKQNFPDAPKVLADPKFREWVQASPIRQSLYQRADQFDYDAAAELFNNWADRTRASQSLAQAEKAGRKAKVKEAATGDTVSNPDNRARKKVYRRADIIKLMQTDPKRYEALQPELMAAYAEGRVK